VGLVHLKGGLTLG